jgi:hypothetical protein
VRISNGHLTDCPASQNCVVSQGADDKHTIDAIARMKALAYGADDKERKNQEIWEGLGFEVIMLPNCHILASGLGAVHCIQKYIKRG